MSCWESWALGIDDTDAAGGREFATLMVDEIHIVVDEPTFSCESVL